MPAASVAVARTAVVELSATLICRPGATSCAAVPETSGVLEQSLVANRRTVDAASAVPRTRGLLSFAGDAGTVEVSDGACGFVESSM